MSSLFAACLHYKVFLAVENNQSESTFVLAEICGAPVERIDKMVVTLYSCWWWWWGSFELLESVGRWCAVEGELVWSFQEFASVGRYRCPLGSGTTW
jgi:hypothetical protein